MVDPIKTFEELQFEIILMLRQNETLTRFNQHLRAKNYSITHRNHALVKSNRALLILLILTHIAYITLRFVG